LNIELNNLPKSEQIQLRLCKLYEQYGYHKFAMNKLEEYSLYVENMNFLPSKEIIVFSDLDGRLMALKPDITLSIAKNAKEEPKELSRMYYRENVFRASRQTHEYKELSQMGLECIGNIDTYTIVEIVSLALKSLAAIDDSYVLAVSHLGFVSSLLDSLNLDYSLRTELLGCMKEKNPHDLTKLCRKAGIGEGDIARLCSLVTLSGDFNTVFAKAKELSVNEEMDVALNELANIYSIVGSEHLQLDFSIVSDLGYYNGIMLQGYVEPVPVAVLSGGQYDNLLAKMGKPHQKAIGFAIYLDSLDSYYRQNGFIVPDKIIIYDDKSDLGAVYREAEAHTLNGGNVLVTDKVSEISDAKSEICDLRGGSDCNA